MMRFAHVTGILFSDREGYRIEVSLDDRRTVVSVRDERIPALLTRNGVPDPWWTVDQLTQETIGTTLAEQGWEAVSETERPPATEFRLPTAVYLVRS
jgi:hypothetical protein